jgi:hypothetical protein
MAFLLSNISTWVKRREPVSTAKATNLSDGLLRLGCMLDGGVERYASNHSRGRVSAVFSDATDSFPELARIQCALASGGAILHLLRGGA